MGRISVQSRVPEHGNREVRHGDWKREAMHSGAQVSGVSFGDTRDQIGGPSEAERGRKAADDDQDFPLNPQWLQNFIERSLFKSEA